MTSSFFSNMSGADIVDVSESFIFFTRPSKIKIIPRQIFPFHYDAESMLNIPGMPW